MLLSILLVTKGLCSFRGAARCLNIMSEWFHIPTPCHVTLRNWVLRMGCHLLTDQQPFEGDWVLILDHTVEQGQEKALVVLGVSREDMENDGFHLRHDQVKVLAIRPQSHPNGEQLHEILEEIAARFTPPNYIVSDKGSDIQRGIALYRNNHHQTGYVYDITHRMANLLKKELNQDPDWEAISKMVSQTARQTRQTELQFLAPNALRSKARFFNLGPLLNWAKKMDEYSRLDELAEIGAGCSLSEEEVLNLRIYNGMTQLKPLEQLQGQRFDDKKSFCLKLREVLGEASYEKFAAAVLCVADKNRRRFTEKFGWLQDYREKVALWSDLYSSAKIPMTHLKKNGLSHQSIDQLKEVFHNPAELTSKHVLDFRQRIVEDLEHEVHQIPKGDAWLATSDIIESIFGKSKIFSQRSPLKTISSLALTIPAFTKKLTVDLVKEGMEKLHMKDMSEIIIRTFGISALQKRKAAFDKLKKVQEENTPLVALI